MGLPVGQPVRREMAGVAAQDLGLVAEAQGPDQGLVAVEDAVDLVEDQVRVGAFVEEEPREILGVLSLE